MHTKQVARVALALVSMVAAGAASATGLVDYSTVSTAAISEVGSAVTGALPVAGPIIGILVGWRLFKRMAK